MSLFIYHIQFVVLSGYIGAACGQYINLRQYCLCAYEKLIVKVDLGVVSDVRGIVINLIKTHMFDDLYSIHDVKAC